MVSITVKLVREAAKGTDDKQAHLAQLALTAKFRTRRRGLGCQRDHLCTIKVNLSSALPCWICIAGRLRPVLLYLQVRCGHVMHLRREI